MSSDGAIKRVLVPWQQAKLQELTRKVVHRLSRLSPSGIFAGCDYNTLWGEYSHHVQFGYFDQVSDLFDDMAIQVCEAIAGGVPPHELLLFDRLAAIYGEEMGMSGNAYLVGQLKNAVDAIASKRDLERYSEGYRWYEDL